MGVGVESIPNGGVRRMWGQAKGVGAEFNGDHGQLTTLGPVMIVAIIAAICWYTALPAHLASWDAVQFALALEHFDLGLHQPHPPGYLAHVGLGAVLAATGMPTDRAIQVASILAAALAIFATGWFARRLNGPAAGLASALILATNPVLGYYAMSGESYCSEVLAAVLLASIAMRSRLSSTHGAVAALGLAWGLSGAFRPTVPILIGPLVLWSLLASARGRGLPHAARLMVTAIAATAAGLLSWLIPLVASAGGLGRFLDLNKGLHLGMAARGFSPLLGGEAASKSLELLMFSLVAVGSVALPAAVATLIIGRSRAVRAIGNGTFYLIWIVPALAWFLLTFFMKAGYALILLPAVATGCGALIVESFGKNRRLTALAVGAVAACQIALFVAPPAWVGGTAVFSLPSVDSEEATVAASLAAVDRLSGGAPETVVVAIRSGGLKFRQAMYYLPSSDVLWLMDSGSTIGGRPGRQVCRSLERKVTCSGEDGFWLAQSLPQTARIELPERASLIAWFLNPSQDFDEDLADAMPTFMVPLPAGGSFLATQLAPGPIKFVVQGYEFQR
jgi:4-amino-4-deoxy-L-arabinose transferase-like glycosyltransferase